MRKIQCCYMAVNAKPDNNLLQCENDGLFEVKENTRQDPDNFTHSCKEHLSVMIGTTEGYPECKSWAIELIETQPKI